MRPLYALFLKLFKMDAPLSHTEESVGEIATLQMAAHHCTDGAAIYMFAIPSNRLFSMQNENNDRIQLLLVLWCFFRRMRRAEWAETDAENLYRGYKLHGAIQHGDQSRFFPCQQ